MIQPARQRILFIVNPVSGLGRQRKVEALVESGIDKEKYEHLFAYTGYAGHGRLLAAKAVEDGMDVVVAVGGDGSVNEVASSLIDTKTIMGILPAGSGNGLAHHLGLPLNLNRALQVLNRQKVLRMDTGLLNNHPFVSLAGIGFDALIARKYTGMKRRGFLPYLFLVLSEYMRYKPLAYRLVLDGNVLDREAFFIVFANSDQFGYGTSIAPNASVCDGLLDVCVLGKPALYKAPRLAWLLFRGEIDTIPQFESYKAREIRVLHNTACDVNLDGEALFIKEGLEVRIRPSSLNIIIP